MAQGTAQKGVQPVSGTVELGATSLAALESITVVDGGGSLTVDGSVAVSNFPATQPVSGTVALDAPTLAALESITVVDGGGSVTVDGSVSVSGTVALDAPSLAALETIQVGSSALPSNAAQETGGALAAIITELLTKARLTDTQPVSVALGATSANQTTELASLATIAAELGAVAASPGAYTVMDRLNQICLKLDAANKMRATDATLQKLLAALKPVPGGSAVRATVLHR